MSEKLRGERSNSGTGTSTPDNRKQSLYFPEGMLQEMKEEAARLDRSLSWVVQRAWKMAKADIAQIPSMSDAASEATTDEQTDAD